ncbi:MAG: DUF3788 domain-containing protein [Treponema sp.]|nr:DUF3788 domain-containing protein [Treponema sp.]
MLDKQHQPSEDEIRRFIGGDSCKNLCLIKNKLEDFLDLNIELKFPFGNTYGWGYKFSHRSKHLFYIFFEKGSLTLMTQINEPESDKEKGLINELSADGRKCWETKYPCKNGGWIHYRFSSTDNLKDVGIFISLRTKKSITLS